MCIRNRGHDCFPKNQIHIKFKWTLSESNISNIEIMLMQKKWSSKQKKAEEIRVVYEKREHSVDRGKEKLLDRRITGHINNK